jgi:hypothetical protein
MRSDFQDSHPLLLPFVSKLALCGLKSFTLTYLSASCMRRFDTRFKSVFGLIEFWLMCMFRSNLGKLMVYAAEEAPRKHRFKSVKTATEETARRLNLDFELIKFSKNGLPIYVYYDGGDEGEPIPLYCDEGKTGDLHEIGKALRKMIFVLSFHPKHSALKRLRTELMRFS